MNIILLERVEKLGQMGDVVKVRPGYARNFLLPRKKALRATPENRAYFDKQRAQLEATNLELRKEAEAVAAKMEGLSVALIRQASEMGQLYGSVSARDLTEAITGAGFTVDRRQVLLDRPIKTLGLHAVKVILHPEVSLRVIANIAPSEEEAKAQLDKQAKAAGTNAAAEMTSQKEGAAPTQDAAAVAPIQEGEATSSTTKKKPPRAKRAASSEEDAHTQ